jgi:dTDP-4-dehydrorhamnose reductase
VRVFVTGGQGQVGTEVVAAFAGSGSGHEVVAPTRDQFDLASRDSVLQAITTTRPDVVVHAGAWTDVDGCELDPDRAYAVNALGTRHVADAARLVGARVLCLSTDYVFSGDLDRPYTEWDDPRPLSVYGRSKLGGERELGPGDTIVRTSWVCGRHGGNVVKTVLAATGDLAFVDDQRGSPTFADDLAAAIHRLVVARLPGSFHVTNQGVTTWFEFARAILAAAGLDTERVRAIKTSQLAPPRPAPRPANSALDNRALRLSGLPLLPPWEESLTRLVKDLG